MQLPLILDFGLTSKSVLCSLISSMRDLTDENEVGSVTLYTSKNACAEAMDSLQWNDNVRKTAAGGSVNATFGISLFLPLFTYR